MSVISKPIHLISSLCDQWANFLLLKKRDCAKNFHVKTIHAKLDENLFIYESNHFYEGFFFSEYQMGILFFILSRSAGGNTP